MQKQALKIATLNLWRFNDWDSRLPRIVDLVRTADPDILLLQEVQRDPVRGPDDQATLLGRMLGYPHAHFEVACIKTARKGVPLPSPVEHGLGIISKRPFKSSVAKLSLANGDTEPRILLTAEFPGDDGSFKVTNVHFANKDDWAEAHLKETLSLVRSERILPILAGDFNIKDISRYKGEYGTDYTASSEAFSYVSYPEDGVSYDQILIPRDAEFLEFKCFEEVISDHRLLSATIGAK